jgi:hypothetical protein
VPLLTLCRWRCSMPAGTHTLYSYTLLLHCIHTLYSYTVLIHYTHTLYSRYTSNPSVSAYVSAPTLQISCASDGTYATLHAPILTSANHASKKGSIERVELSMVVLDFVVPAIERVLWREALSQVLAVKICMVYLDAYSFSEDGHISVQ